jgi:hypothetical protein
MKGYIAAIRVSQAVGNAAVVMNFPEEGVDYIKLIEPYVEFIESNEKLVKEHASLSMYIFLAKRFPVEKQNEPNQTGDDNSE